MHNKNQPIFESYIQSLYPDAQFNQFDYTNSNVLQVELENGDQLRVQENENQKYVIEGKTSDDPDWRVWDIQPKPDYAVYEMKLDTDQYLDLMTKLVRAENNNDLGNKMLHTSDDFISYFKDQKENLYYEVEVDFKGKVLTTDDKGLTFDKLMSDDVSLLHTELKRDQLFQSIESYVKEMGVANIHYNSDLNTNHISLFEKIEPENHIDNIKLLYSEYEKAVQSIDKIEPLLEQVNDYKKNYMNNDSLLNSNIIDGTFQQHSRVSIYDDSWNEMKNLYSRNIDFLKVALNHETQQYLDQKNPSIFKDVNLDKNNLVVSELLAKNDENSLTTGQLLKTVKEANQDFSIDTLQKNVDSHIVSNITDLSIKRLALYDDEIKYENSKLDQYIDKFKENTFSKSLNLVQAELKEVYGQEYSPFKVKPSQEHFYSLIAPIIKNDSYVINTLLENSNDKQLSMASNFVNVNATTLSEAKVQQYWERESLSILKEYAEEKDLFSKLQPASKLFLTTESIEQAKGSLLEKQGEDQFRNSKEYLNELKSLQQKAEHTILSFKDIHKSLIDDVNNNNLSTKNEISPKDNKVMESLLMTRQVVNKAGDFMKELEVKEKDLKQDMKRSESQFEREL